MNQQQLANLILEADNAVSNLEIDPATARTARANALAAAIYAFVHSKQVLVTGVQPGGGTAVGTITE